MNREEIDALWLCALCGARKVVPSLARDCEDRHLAEAEAEEPAKVVDSVPRMSTRKAPQNIGG